MQQFIGRLNFVGIALIVLAALSILDGTRLGQAMARRIHIDAVGPHGYLELLGVLFLILGLVLLVQGARKAEPDAVHDKDNDAPLRDLFIVFGLLVAYVIGVEFLGFTLATLVFLTLVTRCLSMHSWLWCSTFSVVVTAALYIAFVQISDMPLPKGLWGV